jgi:cytochrome P450
MLLELSDFLTIWVQRYYPEPDKFIGERFLPTQDEASNKHSMVTIENSYLAFGTGRHAWWAAVSFSCCYTLIANTNPIMHSPGRFFAVNEIKAFLVYLLSNYDIQLNPNTPPFKNKWFGMVMFPDASANLMTRKRQS